MQAVVKLKKSPISPRKMRLVADLIRGVSVSQALRILKHTPKRCAIHLEKLLLAGVDGWQTQNPAVGLADADLYVKIIHVDSGGMLKRIRPAPKGMAHRIRKRSNHVTLVVDDMQPATLSDVPTEV
ncbi:MAG: 50S ribosomal protein L22 [Bacteroidota bacterium]